MALLLLIGALIGVIYVALVMTAFWANFTDISIILDIVLLLIPFFFKDKLLEKLDKYKVFKVVPEAVALLMIYLMCVGDSAFILSEYVVNHNSYSIYMNRRIPEYAVLGALSGVFIVYTGCVLKLAHKNGLKAFFKTSLLYRLFCTLKNKMDEYCEELFHVNLEDGMRKHVRRFVVINCIIVGIMCLTWFFGLILLIIYGLYTYSFVMKYADRMSRQYATFHETVRQMADGDFEAELSDDLGVYESFRPEFEKIKAGISDAVKEEIKSERMKMELVSNVSHDLKTPLTAMITYIDLLKTEEDEKKREEYVEILSKRSNRLKILIEDLFEVTKATTGNVKFEYLEADIVNLIKQVIFEYEEKYKEMGLEVVTSFPKGRVPVVLDPQKTYRIYSNLIGNIAKYSLRNSRVYMQIEETDKEVIIIFKNISQSKLYGNGNDLTERFVRGDASRNTEGSGLGLAIAKSFTELQGGSLDIVVDGDLFKAVTIWKKAEQTV